MRKTLLTLAATLALLLGGTTAAQASTVKQCYEYRTSGVASFWISKRLIDFNWWEEVFLLKRDGWYTFPGERC